MILPPRYRPLTASVIPGGFGSVQAMRDEFLDRTVLFKSMLDNANNGQLLNEIQGLSKARSRHVVEIYDVIFDGDGSIAGIIIELLGGRDYETFHQEAAASPHEYLRALYQIATALADLHAAGVVHRDLKLQNLKSSSSGVLKIFDFGIAVATEEYKTKANRGTYVYAGPELFVQGALIEPSLDVYALGVCAWTLAVAQLPQALLERPPQRSGRAPSLRAFWADTFPQEVYEILDRCLEPNPALRPPASEVRAALNRQLVRGRHRGLFVQGRAAVYELNAANANVGIKIGTYGEIRVEYTNGTEFKVANVIGDVYINNLRAKIGDVLHGACVLAFGGPDRGSDRAWVTFSSSHPEVVI